MSKIVFSLTEPQVSVLLLVKRGAEIGWRDGGTANTLRKRGMLVQGRDYREYTLTPLGVAAAAVAVALAPASPKKK